MRLEFKTTSQHGRVCVCVGGDLSCVVIYRANVSKQIGELTHVANTQPQPDTAWYLDKNTTASVFFVRLISLLG